MNISVCIATYGAAEWGELAWTRARPSVDAQTRPPYEVKAVHLPDGTLAQARNAAAAACTGDWLCFVDADDELEPGYLEAIATVESFASSDTLGAPLLVPAVRYVGESFVDQQAWIPNKGLWPRVNECVIGTVVPRACFEHVGGFREWPSIEDYDLWLRCYDAGADLVYVEGAVYRAHVNPDGGRNRDQSCYAQIWAEHEARMLA